MKRVCNFVISSVSRIYQLSVIVCSTFHKSEGWSKIIVSFHNIKSTQPFEPGFAQVIKPALVNEVFPLSFNIPMKENLSSVDNWVNINKVDGERKGKQEVYDKAWKITRENAILAWRAPFCACLTNLRASSIPTPNTQR